MTTTDNSRADALTDMLRRMLHEFGEQHYHGCPQDAIPATGPCECFAGVLCSEARTLLAASPVEQPAAAPIDGVVGPLRDDQRQHAISLYLNLPHSWESAQAVINSVSADAYVNGRKDAAPAPSPADERTATPIGYIRADDLKELAEGNGAIVSPRCRETDVPVFARAASANETGAEGAHEVDCADCGWHGSGNDLASGEDDGHGKRAVCPKCGADEEELSFAGLSRSPAMEAEAVAIPAGWKLVPIEPTSLMIRRGNQHRLLSIGPTWEAMLDAAPQPAQPDARVGLTNEQRSAIENAVADKRLGSIDVAALRALLAGASK